VKRNRAAGRSPSSSPNHRVVTVVVALAALVALVAGGAVLTGSPSAPAGAASPSPWTIVPTPNPGAIDYVLNGVSCTSWTQCIAVGAAENTSHVYGTLIEEWNGTNWFLMTSPDQGSGDNRLTGVNCSSASSCVAVGYYYPSSLPRTLVESWNGTSWTIVASPNVGAGDNLLAGVSCSDAIDCVAVGSSYSSTGVWQTLVESWNGTTWTIVTSPDVGSGDNLLSGVSCTSPNDCVAAGSSHSSTGVLQTLVESWNGTSWTIATSPDPGSGNNSLSAVSCASSASCLAVGTEGDLHTLVESWDGTNWTAATSPDPGNATNFLTGVSCAGPDQCEAVGSFSDRGTTGYVNNIGQTLVLSWDGTNVTQVPSPEQGTAASNFPEGVSCIGAGGCVMAGWYFVASSFQGGQSEATLAEMASGGTTADNSQPSVSPSPAVVNHTATFKASVAPAAGSGTPTGGVEFAIGSTNLCSATLVNGTGSCTSAQAPLGQDTVVATYVGDPTYSWSSGTAQLIVERGQPSVTCAKVGGNASKTLTLTSCTPGSATNNSAGGPGSALNSGGTLKWSTSGGTTIASWTTSSPGQGACATYLTEHELSGVVTGGTSTYTKKGDPVSIDLCQGPEGGLTIAPSTTAKL
jgi:Bacterial Ig-like domain (group 3)